MRLNCKPSTPDSPLRPEIRPQEGKTETGEEGGAAVGAGEVLTSEKGHGSSGSRQNRVSPPAKPETAAAAQTLGAGAGHARARPRPFTYFLSARPSQAARARAGAKGHASLPAPGSGPRREDRSLRVGFSPHILVFKGFTCFQSERMI